MKYLILVLFIAVTSGCSTYPINSYSINSDNVKALRYLRGKTINVAEFSAIELKREITCRGLGPVQVPGGKTFAEFIRNAFVEELEVANAFSTAATVTLKGNIDKLDFSSSGWIISLTITSSNGEKRQLTENYQFPTAISIVPETACNQIAQAFVPAVQNLIGQLVRSEKQFRALIDF